jgi:hypothetical protein
MIAMISLTEDDAPFASQQLANGCDTLENLLQGLLTAETPVAEQIHAIRKLGKSLRGGFALFGLAKSSARDIQAVGRLLSESRDAVSRLSTWRKLEWSEQATSAAAITKLLEQLTLSAAHPTPPETIAWCIERVATAKARLLELPPETHAERITSGIRKLEKRVIKRAKRLDHNHEECFHDARKALKAYLGALGFLPQTTATPPQAMTDLTELLGDENDLATLSNWLERHGFNKNFVPSLWKDLSKARRKLRRKAIRDAAQLTSPRDATAQHPAPQP